MEPYREVAASYRGFAAEAQDSPTFVDWALSVADDPEVAAWIEQLPPVKQQPNLVFAAARWHGVPAPGPYGGLRHALLADEGPIRHTILTRSTQTNEVGRMATLLPALSTLIGIDEPVALLEVGPSAGLCLYPDRWGYDWQTDAGEVLLGDAPRLPCRVKGPAPLPAWTPRVTWRGGLDLNPLDVRDADAMAWLENLVWPEQHERRARLRHGIELAQSDPPMLVGGNLLHDLPELIASAAEFGTVVVFHSAVIAYVPPEDRPSFDTLMRELVASGVCHWISNEGKDVLPSITETGPPLDPTKPTFVLGVDGQMVARAHGHGRTMTWTAR